MAQFMLGSSNTNTVSADRESADRVPADDQDGIAAGLRAEVWSGLPNRGFHVESAGGCAPLLGALRAVGVKVASSTSSPERVSALDVVTLVSPMPDTSPEM
jgi:hypothetical protein